MRKKSNMGNALRSKVPLVPSVPFVEARFQGGKQRPSRIVFRSSVTSSERGAAFKVANYQFTTSKPIKSYHYVVDSSAAFRCADDRTVVLHGDDNVKGSIVIGLCAPPFSVEEFWDDSAHVGVLNQAADLTAQLCVIHKIPVRSLDDEREQKWYRRSPGGLSFELDGVFPVEQFLANIQTKVAIHKSAFSRR